MFAGPERIQLRLRLPDLSLKANRQPRHAVFNFVDGTHLVFERPVQAPNDVVALEGGVRASLASSQFAAQVGGNLVVAQVANVNYV